jgi:activator of 2-hydroxyglutaryl-CoA dehydratase
VARRVVQMVRRYHPEKVLFCGGVALNQGVVERLKFRLEAEVIVPPEPRFNGALGCALEV